MPASEMRAHEQIRGLTGPITVVSRGHIPGNQRVHNMTVEADHRYHVSSLGVLSHNNNECPPNTPPPNMSPPGAGRQGALNEAKRNNDIPTSQQPSSTGPNIDKRGDTQPGRTYTYTVPKPGGGTQDITIRDDAGGHNYGPGDPQNRGPHFNDPAGNRYDY